MTITLLRVIWITPPRPRVGAGAGQGADSQRPLVWSWTRFPFPHLSIYAIHSPHDHAGSRLCRQPTVGGRCLDATLVVTAVVRLRTVLCCRIPRSLLIVATAPVRREAAPSWRLTLPFVPHPGHASSRPPASSSVGGLVVAWIRLGAFAADREQSLRRRVCIVVAAGAFVDRAIVLAPPLLSNDVYTTAAQGELASRGSTRPVVGPNALGGGPFMRAADAIWWNNPRPTARVEQGRRDCRRRTDTDAASACWACGGSYSSP